MPLQKHHYWLGSIALHAALIALLAWWLEQREIQTSLQTQQTKINSSAQVAEQAYLRRKVDSLKAMKELMERIDQAQQGESKQDGQQRDDAPDTQQAEMQMPKALQEAKQLRDRIQQMEQAARAKELAELLKIPEPQALDKVRQEDAQKTQKAGSGEDPADTLERYQQQAQEALERRQRQDERQRNGSLLQTAQHEGNGSRGGAGGAGKPGTSKGEPGNKNGNAGTEGQGGSGRANDPRYARAAEEPNGEHRQYSARQPVAIARSDLRLGQGNVLGAGGRFGNRIVLDRWYVIGPFAASDKRAINTRFPPEMLVDLDGVYLGKGQRVLQWQYISSAPYPLIPPNPVAKGVYYGYTEIRSDTERDVWLALGADDDAKLWVNDRLVWTSGTAFKPWYNAGGFSVRRDDIASANLIEERRLVHLKRGRNTVLFKLYNGILDVFIAVALEPA